MSDITNRPGPIREYHPDDMKVGGTTIGEMREELFPFTRLDAMRSLVIEIMHGAILGQDLVARRLRLMPEYATHHEDYKPMFDLIAGLAINLQALLKHAEIEEMRNAGPKDGHQNPASR